jgi:ribonuclease VapC
MIIDSSAVLAVIGKEPGYERIIHELAGSQETWIGAPTRLEAGIELIARLGPRGKTVLARFLQENAIKTVSFDEEHAPAALDAYSRFGKGRHPAGLNFGDCCTYAVAARGGEPLLCVGDDFPETDVQLVSLDEPEALADPQPPGEPSQHT